MNVKELYEKQYSQKKLVSPVSYPLLRKIFRKLDLSREDLALSFLGEDDKLLDVGSGSGSLMFKAKEKFTELYGVDISPSRVEEASRKAVEKFGSGNNLHFLVCDIDNKIDFPDNMFEAAVSIATIEHVFDPYFVVGQIHRILKPGGLFIAEVPNIAYLKHRIKLLFGQLPVTASAYNDWKEVGWDGGHLHYFTKKTFCDLLKGSGFEILKVSGTGMFAKYRNFYPSLLTGNICVKAVKL